MNMEKMEFLAFNENRFFGDEFNLSYYNKTRLILEELKALITKENPTQFDFNYIYKKIIQYSLLANYTNNHEEAEKAIQYFKDLKSIYPNFINWEEVYKNLVLLEALTISNKQNTKEAYYYILDQEGFLYEEENVLESYIEDYPEIFHKLLKDKKKLSYFSGISQGKLTSLENSYSSDKDIIDEKKEIYSFSEFLKNIKPNINNLM